MSSQISCWNFIFCFFLLLVIMVHSCDRNEHYRTAFVASDLRICSAQDSSASVINMNLSIETFKFTDIFPCSISAWTGGGTKRFQESENLNTQVCSHWLS
jgi:hypothetical protein